MRIATFSISAIASLAIAKGDYVGVRSSNSAEPPALKGIFDAPGLTSANTLRVDYLYTYGAPASAKHPHHANPGNTCIPGIRVYTEDFGWPWWAPWGTMTNTDFAAAINAKYGYGHPKISTLALRNVLNGRKEYYWLECKDSDNHDHYHWEWYPSWSSVAKVISHIHSLDTEYEPRLASFLGGNSHPLDVSATNVALQSPLLDYTSVAGCNGMPKANIIECLAQYSDHHSGIGGVQPLNWEVDGVMNHVTHNAVGTDNDYVYTLTNDSDPSFRKCIITFQSSKGIADFASFLFGNEGTTGYCGRTGVHIGIRNELWQITNDSQWASVIKPSLETCDEVTCVGHSLGGALCNTFTMCANTGAEYLVGNTNAEMQEDYDSLVWTKKLILAKGSVEQGANTDMVE